VGFGARRALGTRIGYQTGCHPASRGRAWRVRLLLMETRSRFQRSWCVVSMTRRDGLVFPQRLLRAGGRAPCNAYVVSRTAATRLEHPLSLAQEMRPPAAAGTQSTAACLQARGNDDGVGAATES
jgi:hypothetical protein